VVCSADRRGLDAPHIGYLTARTMAHWYEDAVENIAAWQRGQPIRVLTAS
jgi:phosphoglycerate dehydrogenase-like enzyme